MRNQLKYLIIALLSLNQAYSQETVDRTITHDGLERNFIFYVPSSYEPTGDKISLVFSFHGFTSNAGQQQLYTGMDAVAEANGFIVCYPDGIGASWNVNAGFGSDADDIGFTETMIDNLDSEYNIDRQRIYACGMSNGGFFSYRLACELSDKIAAVASVTGSFTADQLATCSPSRKVPVMEVHGTEDLIVPYNGSAMAVATEDVIQFWVDFNECEMTPDTTNLENSDPSDGTTSEVIEYLICSEESEVVLVKVTGGGHSWPGATINLPGTSQDYNGSQLVWDFFNRHQLPAVLFNKEISSSTLSIFPNPANDRLFIRDVPSIEKVTIYDMHGKVILTTLQEVIDISSLSTGLYLLEVSDTTHRYVERFIKE